MISERLRKRARGHHQDGKFTGPYMYWGIRLLRHRGETWALQVEEWCAHTTGKRA